MSTPVTRMRFEGPTLKDESIVWTKTKGGGFTNTRPGGSIYKAMTDIVTPGYHQKIRDGEIINNPCNLDVSSWTASESTSELRYNHVSDTENWTIKQSGNLSAWLITDLSYQPYLYWLNDAPVPSFDVDSQAKSFCLANVDTTPFEFGEDIGELRETLLFLRNPLSGLANLAKVYKRRRKALKSNPKFKERPKAEAKALADLWNQYQFAFAPLVRSIMSACEAWDNRDTLEHPARRSAHGFSKNKEKDERGVRKLAPNGADAYWTMKSTRQVESHATIYYEVSNPLADFRFALGLRLKDLPKTFWQLWPLSFMMDRVYNLSNAIAGVTNLTFSSYTVSILAASLTKRYVNEKSISLTGLVWSNSEYTFILSGTPDSLLYSEFEYDRVVWTPEVWDAFPPITAQGLTDSVTKTIDLIALITSRLL